VEDIGHALGLALGLVVAGDPEFLAVVGLSLRVSLTGAAAAFCIGVPLAAALATARCFPGRGALLVLANAALGLPPVVIGLVVYLLLSRSGPLGALGWLFTPSAMVLAQTLLATPIVVALAHRAVAPLWADYGDALRVDGAGPWQALRQLAAMGRAPLVTVFLAAFGRCIAEVGAILVVGGNIRGYTRTMTTAIALETSKGDLPLALALGTVLVSLCVLVSAAALTLERRGNRAAAAR
jgi:tungstate transport system permease protein